MVNQMLVIKGKPRGKGRPRFTRYGHAFTDEKTREYEKLIKQEFDKSYHRMVEGYVSLTIKAYYQIPKATSKRVSALMLEDKILPIVKPDIDNVVKCILDGLNGKLYKDDNQVVKVVAEKHYSFEPRVEVYIE